VDNLERVSTSPSAITNTSYSSDDWTKSHNRSASAFLRSAGIGAVKGGLAMLGQFYDGYHIVGFATYSEDKGWTPKGYHLPTS
jgi:hypothetical protein